MAAEGHNQYMMLLSDLYPFNLFTPEPVAGTLFPPHWHDECLEMVYVTKGSAEFRIGGTKHIVEQGDLALIGEGQIHSGYAEDGTPMYYTILLDRSRMVNADTSSLAYSALLTGRLEMPTILKPGDLHYGTLTNVITAVIAEFNQRELGFEHAAKSHLHVLLTYLSRFYGSSAERRDRRQVAAMRQIDRIKDVIAHVERHYSESLTVNQAASVAAMSPYHFCRVFKGAVGRTFNEYVQLFRIAQAETLIRDTDLPITLIAERCGFGSVHYFDELFKRHRGQTPTQARKGAT
ncbi:AraC family transcriptional regulator [Paenibacillus methanolicus]|uniref:AraC-like DNA-binding protein n=1 Tax=Paenibacillus methanolicus TaxID=582686 RepID=A0A5S5CJ97_9BACL|nr:AraC family transcriptional regulator [Paenibacillus methanolicus]TYP79093.1 AraC-like DNA-binding protein [Paenibacillus methanolicus]